MVLGIARPRLRTEGPRLFALRSSTPVAPTADDWAERRGNLAFEGTADVNGGFPAFADLGCWLSGAQVRVTDRFLLVDEGTSHGFGIALSTIEGTSLEYEPGRDDPALRIFYRERDLLRGFCLHFRPNRLSPRGTKKGARVQQLLRSFGIEDRFLHQPPLQPNFALPWDQTRDIESENVIWTGRVNAPITVGGTVSASDVWLTTRSIIWGSGVGDGINRVPLVLLQDMVSTRLRDRLGTPVIYLAIGNEQTGRFELPFIFDLEASPDRNFRERGAFLVGLRSRGLPDGEPACAQRPWRPEAICSTGWQDDPEDEDAPDESQSEIAAVATEAVVEEVVTPEPIDETPVEAEVFTSELPELEEDPTERFHPIAFASAEPESTPEETAADDLVLAEWTGGSAEPESGADVQIAVAWLDLAPAAESEPEIDPLEDDDVQLVVTPQQRPERSAIDIIIAAQTQPGQRPWFAVKHYEESAIGALSDALRVISSRVSGDSSLSLTEATPTTREQAAALDELANQYTAGVMTAHMAAVRRERILALGEVCVRLRTLVELFDGAYITAEELDAKRAKLVQGLSAALIPTP